MKTRSVLLWAGIVSLVFVPLALASQVQLTVRDAASGLVIDAVNPYSTCSGPLTPQQLSIDVLNTGSSSDTYSLSFVSLPTGWTGNIQDTITLAAGEEQAANLFLVNMPSPATQPGTYQLAIEARSLTTGHTDKRTVPLNVLSCNAVAVTPITPTQTLCQETGGSLTYSVEVHNKGKFQETFDLSSSVSWAALSTHTVTLASGAKKTITVTVTPPTAFAGTKSVTITAQSTSSYASGSGTFSVAVHDCYDFTASLQPSSRQVCMGGKSTYTLTLTNTNDDDSYTISTPSWVSGPSSVSLASGETRQLQFTATPKKIGVLPFTLTVTSDSDAALSKTATASLVSQECRGIAVIVSPADNTICKGTDAQYTVTAKNTGSVTETFTLSSTAGTIGKTTMVLASNETQSATLTVDTAGMLGEKIVTVTASAPGISDSSNTILTAENCHDAALTIAPAVLSACPCTMQDFTLTLQNTGKKADTYTLNFANATAAASVQPGENHTEIFSVPVACEQAGSYIITATAASADITRTATSSLNVKPLNTCYAVNLSNTDTAAAVDVSEGIAVPITVSNTGESDQTFTLSAAGADWLYLSPRTLFLPGGKTGNAYLYATPPFGTHEGDYAAIVTATSSQVQADYSLTVAVGKGGEVSIQPPSTPSNTTPPTNINTTPDSANASHAAGDSNRTVDENNESISISPNEGITLGATFENVTGEIIKKTDIPSFKTIAIGIITIIIIIILVVRFALLMRK